MLCGKTCYCELGDLVLCRVRFFRRFSQTLLEKFDERSKLFLCAGSSDEVTYVVVPSLPRNARVEWQVLASGRKSAGTGEAAISDKDGRGTGALNCFTQHIGEFKFKNLIELIFCGVI